MPLDPDRLREIVAELVSKPGHEKVRVLVYELLVHGLGLESRSIDFERRLPEVRGRLDALLGQTVFEFKRDFRRERRDAEEELGRYLPQRERETGERFVGIATDGSEFVPYAIEKGALTPLASFRPSLDKPRDLLVWLDTAVSVNPEIAPEPEVVRQELGRESLAFRRALALLRGLWDEVKDDPEAKLKRQLWSDFLAVVYGDRIEADDLFLQHTYLSAVAKTMATRVLGVPLPEPADLLSGKPFAEAGIAGAVESDFFDWPLHAKDGADLIARISRQTARFRLDRIEHDVLKVLYESLIDPETRHDLGEYYTPDWLAYRICARAITKPLEQRILDPACGSGTFLFHAIRRFMEAADRKRMKPRDALRGCLENVIGIDVHPVAVLVARVTYLLALGEDRLRHRPKSIAIPVYLGDSLQWNTRQLLAETDVVVQVKDGPELRFPEGVATEPAAFDEIVQTMLRLSDQNAAPDAFRTWLRREGKAMEQGIATLVATYDHLRSLRRAGRNHIWGYIARNLTRPLWLSSFKHRSDVLVGNPPWLSFRYMSKENQQKFREECRARHLWAGGKVATHQDMSAYFFAKCVELYLTAEGTIAFVMPYAAFGRAQFAGFRTGRFSKSEVLFAEAWAFDDTVQPLFPVPSAVFVARRETWGSLPKTVTACTGHLPRRDATPEEAKKWLTCREEAWPKAAVLKGGSPYRKMFRQGATMVPRRLCVVERVEAGRLGGNPEAPLVESRIGTQDKKPWRDLEPLRHNVELDFIRPLYLGESVAPFRLLAPVDCVVPWDAESKWLLDAAAAQAHGYPGLAAWLAEAEALWDRDGTGGMSLKDRWNYHGSLAIQFPMAPIRIAYAASGTLLAAAILRDERSVIEHKLYWAKVGTLAEAQHLAAILNSESLRKRVAHLQSRGQWGARDFDKLVFEVRIPRFSARETLHRELAQAAREAEKIAAAIPLDEGMHFVTARKRIRDALAEAGIARRIDGLVERLLPR